MNVCGGSGNGGELWELTHPNDEQIRGCCYGEALRGPEACTCWQPVFEMDQQPCAAATGPHEVAPERCADCAFRPGSPELTDPYSREWLLELAQRGEQFWCHTGMRRPIRWQHPDGRTVSGDTNDWQPPIDREHGVPFRADGRPGVLCAGWVGQAASLARRVEAVDVPR